MTRAAEAARRATVRLPLLRSPQARDNDSKRRAAARIDSTIGFRERRPPLNVPRPGEPAMQQSAVKLLSIGPDGLNGGDCLLEISLAASMRARHRLR